MRISTRGRYAVMAMADLAQQWRVDKTRIVPLAEISARQEISLAYLEQIFNALRRAGLVESVRGAQGGYRLARAAEHLCVSDIIAAADAPIDVTRCQMAAGCMNANARCMTHDLWARLGAHIDEFLSAVSLADVVTHDLPRP